MQQALNSPQLAGVQKGMAWFSVLLGVLVLAIGGIWVHRNHWDGFLLYAGSTQGEVIENHAEQVHIASNSGSSLGRNFTAYTAVVQFTGQKGEKIRFLDHMGFGQASFTVGQKVKVYYDPENPEDAQIDRGLKNLIIPAMIFITGCLCIRGGMLRFRSVRRASA